MIGAAAANWELLDGTESVDMMELPIDRFCNRVLAWLRARMRDSDWQSYQFRLNLPPPGVVPEVGPWSEDEIAATWRGD